MKKLAFLDGKDGKGTPPWFTARNRSRAPDGIRAIQTGRLSAVGGRNRRDPEKRTIKFQAFTRIAYDEMAIPRQY
jgi:hypothetical protein